MSDREFEEFTRAEALGLFDHLRKSHSRGLVASLSRGADSAAVACLVSLSVRLCLGEISFDGLCRRLEGLVDLPYGIGPNEIVSRLLRLSMSCARSSADHECRAATNALSSEP